MIPFTFELAVDAFLKKFTNKNTAATKNTNKVKIYQEKRYKCRRCNYYFTESHEYCPNCATDGEKVKLRIVNVDMT